MSRQRPFPVTFPKVDPTPGHWSAVGSRIYVGDVQIADCALPGSDFNHQRTNIDQVEQRRHEGRANAHLMATAKEAIALLKEVRASFDGDPDLYERIGALITKAEG